MKRLMGLVLVVFAVMMAAPASYGASHREAPLIAADPTADITDFFFFRSWSDPDKAVLIMNVIPFEEPSGGPNFYNFGDDVLYEIHIDNDRDNIADDIVYQIRFKTEIRSPGDKLPLSYVALPPITALDGAGSAGLLLRQSYTVTEVKKYQKRELGRGTMFAVPSNVGPRTMPEYEDLARQGIYQLANGGRVFAGQRDDTFYIDLGGAFDTLNFHVPVVLSAADDANNGENVAGAVDALSGFNVNTIAIEVPIGELTNGKNKVLGAYASTSRPRSTVVRGKGYREHSKEYVQVARMANPLVNELIIATSDKDRWNATSAENEVQFLKYYCSSALAGAMNAVFRTSFPTANRNDLANTLLRYGDKPVKNICRGTDRRLAELLRVDLSVAPTAPEDQKRLGPLAHDASGTATPDAAGWPNGRRPNDDVTDVALRVVAGALIIPATPMLGDGVNFNNGAVGHGVTDNGIALEFPFLPTPYDGRDSRHLDVGETP
jgi:hypothetical protein